jgi:hypothetical protein
LVGPLLAGQAPMLLGPYTTMFTHGFDSAIITPATMLAGIFVLQRKPLGYLLAAPLLMLCTLIGMVGSRVVMGGFAVWLAVAFFKNVADITLPTSYRSDNAANKHVRV